MKVDIKEKKLKNGKVKIALYVNDKKIEEMTLKEAEKAYFIDAVINQLIHDKKYFEEKIKKTKKIKRGRL